MVPTQFGGDTATILQGTHEMWVIYSDLKLMFHSWKHHNLKGSEKGLSLVSKMIPPK